jgi:predicted esterase
MMKTRRALLFCLIVAVCLAITAAAQNPPAAGGQTAQRGGDGAVPNAAPAANAGYGASRVTSAPTGKTAGQSRRTGMDPVDDRVELREYLFKETDEWLPYAVFVSSKVTKDKKAPMVLALHGMSGNHGTFMRTPCVDEAEKNGYILVGVMGYSPNAPFGRTMGARGGRGAPANRSGAAAPGAAVPGGPGGMGAGVPGATPGRAPMTAPDAAPGGRGGFGMGMGRGPAVGGTKETDSAKATLLSEKDTMYVLEMVRKEFNIDDNRIYLMGHSMGGAGALYLGEKYAPLWAAVAGLAGFGSPDPKGKMKDTPLYLTAGSLDSLGRSGPALAEQLKAGGMDCEWKEVPGLDHGGIIGGAMPDVFKFFNEHIKGQPKK